MLLKIILVIVFVKIVVDILWVKEGLIILDPPILNKVGDKKGNSRNCNINIKFPNPEYKKDKDGNFILKDGNLILIGYNNENNFMFNNFNNIKRAVNRC